MSLGAVARPLALGALLSSIVGRGLSEALPGSRSGIGDWITATNVAGALLTQLTVIVGATLGALLMLTTVWQKAFPYAYRLLAMPTGAAVLTLVALSTRQNLSPIESMALALCATAATGASAIVVLRHERTRAVGLILASAALAAATYSASRGLHWWDVFRGQTDVASLATVRSLATAGWCLDFVSLALATAILLALGKAWGRAGVLLSAALAIVLAFIALGGGEPGASLPQLLAARTLSEMTPGPAPYIPALLRYASEGYALTVSLCLILVPKPVGAAQVAAALAVLGRGSPEIPFCALLFILAAVLAPMGTLDTGRTTVDPL